MCFIYSNAQSLKVGEWRGHLSYKNANAVCRTDHKIYTSTDRALFVYNTEDNSVERINTLNGLSDTGVSYIESDGNTLIIAYENGNIDLIQGAKTLNLPDIKRASLIGSKRINHIDVVNEFAYLSCGFGIVVLDIEKQEIKDTYFIGANGAYVNILSTKQVHNSIYAATESGIYSANLDQPNLANFEVWEKLNFHTRSRVDLLESFNDLLFANFQGASFNTDTIYSFDGNNWEVFDQGHSNVSLKASGQYLTIARRFGIVVYDQELNQTRHLSSSVFNEEKIDFRACLFAGDNEYWIADRHNGLLHYHKGFSESIQPSGPFYSEVVQIKNFGDEIWLAHGAKNENWDPTWTKRELSILKIDDWSSTNELIEQEFEDVVAINQNDGVTYAASWQDGLVKMNGTEVEEIYNETNSTLQKRAVYDDWIEVGDIQFDREGNMWCTNSQTFEPLSVLYSNGEWASFSLGSGVTEHQDIAKMLIDQNDQKWIQLKNNGIVVFDEKRSGINVRKLTSGESAGNLASDRVFSFVEDLNGEIWVGTDNGVSVFYNPEDIFEGENASKIMVALGGHNTYLLDGQRVNDIEIDGANRKWFAMNNSGVIVTSENGTEEIHHFTLENSPLFSNKVLDIEINDVTGEVFFATDKGLISFRSGATKGNGDFSEVLVFPNPVKPDYQGLITIQGLITDAVVKITDISGNLIYETVALGGQAVWDGKSFQGKKAHTGVYLIFCSDEDGNMTHVTKLLFVRG
jgi:streptogramin lyase